MSHTVIVLLALSGLSESAGRLLPLIASRNKSSLYFVIGLLVTGTVVEGTVIASWPIAAWTAAELVRSASQPELRLIATTDPVWTPNLLAPLLLSAILAFPLLGPFLHTLLIFGVGTGLVGPIAAASGLGWWTSGACVAVAGFGLAVTVQAVRRLIGRRIASAAEKDAIV